MIHRFFLPVKYQNNILNFIRSPIITNKNNLFVCTKWRAEQIPTVSNRFLFDKAKLENFVVDFEQVKKATTNDNIFIIDVREPDEIKEHGKIPNSINIPLGKVFTALSTLSDQEFMEIYNRKKPLEDSEIIFYCMIGKRSGMAQENANTLGYKNVKNYVGSWTDWTKNCN